MVLHVHHLTSCYTRYYSYGIFDKSLKIRSRDCSCPQLHPLTSWNQVTSLLHQMAGWMYQRVTAAWASLDLHTPQPASLLPEPNWRTSELCPRLPDFRRQCQYLEIRNNQGLSLANPVRDNNDCHHTSVDNVSSATSIMMQKRRCG